MKTSGTMIVLALAVAFTEGAEVTFVRCPNGALCPDRTTCCLQNSGQYGCCPYQFAMCCSDHLHCCPEGYHCNMSNGTCLQISTTTKKVETLLTPMVLSPQLGPNAPAVKDVRCPDGSFCWDGQTCCMVGGGFYDCCPYSHAVCCSDHASCCPDGYRCEVSTQSCVAGNSTLPMLKKIDTIRESYLEEPAPVEIVRCPGGGYCQDGQTCCLVSGGHYGCCPYPHAVCCSDLASCCPEGYRCKVSTHSCVAGNSTLPMLKKIDTIGGSPLKEPAPVEIVRCPGGGWCQDGQTCCLVSGGHYGCCPYPHAVCCSDLASCCPEGYRCKVSTHSCVAGNSTLPMLKKIDTVGGSPLKEPAPVEIVRCPGGGWCQDGQTCCLVSGGHYGCCPYPHAVCCSDLASCCPEGYRCKVSTHSCVAGNSTLPMLKKIDTVGGSPLKEPAPVEIVRCPGGGWCQDGQTCCLVSGGHYGCCPYPHAVCCSDLASCCPEGYRCKVSTHSCVAGNSTLPMLKKIDTVGGSPLKEPAPVEIVRCPGGGWCQDGQTCCLVSGGHYGCCPYPHAVCCSDLASCCPEGYRCKVSTHSCVAGNSTLPMLKKIDTVGGSPLKEPAPVEIVRCPGGGWCQDGQTCCLVSGGHYGCCPYPHAVCCSDLASCCPEGYRCKVSTHSCVAGNSTLPMLKKIDTVGGSPLKEPAPVEIVRCPGGGWCQDGQTCCLVSGGHYGCCPYPHAVCCSDLASCCPEGYRCKVSTHSCVAGNSTLPMLKKIDTVGGSPLKEPAPVQSVRCPDGRFCQDSQTCCVVAGGRYGCCPYPHAVCCSDRATCCPEGYRCKMSTHSCVAGNSTLPMLKKIDAIGGSPLKEPAPVEKVRCPDGNYCQDGQTCCLTMGGRYGCCPYPYAECCSDHASCCPEGYRCHMSTHSCILGNSTVPMLKKISTFSDSPAPVEKIRCPDGNYCQDGQTCCLTAGGRFSCCPYPFAECCSDYASCCPEGYLCHMSTHSCMLGNSTVAMLKKISTFSDNPAPGNTVSCPDGSSCLDQQTCCQSKNGSYGCCPTPEAVCCEDHETCCPKGTVCVEEIQACIGLSEMSPMLKKVPAFRTEKKPRLGQLTLPRPWVDFDGLCHPLRSDTCCQIQGGSYGCCPYEDATCCSDDVHCCPSGYECDTSATSCRKGDIFAAALRKFPARRPLLPVVNDAT
ncbi:hypothetical protein HPB47_014159, partial [Ixodes persulcatus]